MRVYNEAGAWTMEADAAMKASYEPIAKAFDVVQALGFNPREAMLLLQVQVDSIGLPRAISNVALSRKRPAAPTERAPPAAPEPLNAQSSEAAIKAYLHAHMTLDTDPLEIAETIAGATGFGRSIPVYERMAAEVRDLRFPTRFPPNDRMVIGDLHANSTLTEVERAMLGTIRAIGSRPSATWLAEAAVEHTGNRHKSHTYYAFALRALMRNGVPA